MNNFLEYTEDSSNYVKNVLHLFTFQTPII